VVHDMNADELLDDATIAVLTPVLSSEPGAAAG
jgi:hypothetical protein